MCNFGYNLSSQSVLLKYAGISREARKLLADEERGMMAVSCVVIGSYQSRDTLAGIDMYDFFDHRLMRESIRGSL